LVIKASARAKEKRQQEKLQQQQQASKQANKTNIPAIQPRSNNKLPSSGIHREKYIRIRNLSYIK